MSQRNPLNRYRQEVAEPEPETAPPIQPSTRKTVKPVKVKRIFSYKIDAAIGERIRLYARKVADRPVGDVLEQAAREFLERVGG